MNNYWSKKDRTTFKRFWWGCGRRLELSEIRSVIVKTFFIVDFVLTEKWPSMRQVRVTVDPDPIIDIKIAFGYIKLLLKDNNLNF